MSLLQNAAAFFKAAGAAALSDLEVQAIPVVQGGLAILQKSPNALGAAAAEAYVLGNAPAALVTAEQAFINQEFGAIGTALQGLLAKAQATQPAAPTA